MADIKKMLANATNNNPTHLIFNALRNEMGSDFTERVPAGTLDNVNAVGAAITSDRTTLNSFATGMVEKFGMSFFNDTMLENKLKHFKRGKMPVGFKIEELFVEAAKGTKYDPENAYKEENKRKLPDVRAIYHVENRRDKYEASISNAEVKTAFQSWDGVNNLFVKILESLYNGNEIDEFTLMKTLLVNYAKKGLFKFVKVKKPVDKDSADEFATVLKTYSNLLEFMSNEYNAMDVITQTSKDQQHLIQPARIESRMSVSSLANAFNMDKVQFQGHSMILDNFLDIQNTAGCLVSDKLFMVFDTDEEMASKYVTKGRYWNYTYHKWGIFSMSRFASAIMFVYDDGVTPINPITSVLVSPVVDVIKLGETREYTAIVNMIDDTTTDKEPQRPTGENDEEGNPIMVDYSKTVTWKLSGNTDTKTKITIDTKDKNKCYLEVGADETAISLVVTATSDDDATIKGSSYIQVGDFFGNS